MSPKERAAINEKVLGGPEAVSKWLAVTDALHVFANATDALAGEDVVKWYAARSDACFRAQDRAAKANSRTPPTASQVPGRTNK